VTMMQVEEKPDVTYSDVGGCKEQIDKLREVKLDINVLIY
jgi:26S proteasome regulatory subunit T1